MVGFAGQVTARQRGALAMGRGDVWTLERSITDGKGEWVGEEYFCQTTSIYARRYTSASQLQHDLRLYLGIDEFSMWSGYKKVTLKAFQNIKILKIIATPLNNLTNIWTITVKHQTVKPLRNEYWNNYVIVFKRFWL